MLYTILILGWQANEQQQLEDRTVARGVHKYGARGARVGGTIINI